MKKSSSLFFLSVCFLFVLSACKKINEPTNLGGDLIPPVDNVNTFETSLETVTDNLRMNDSSKVGFNDLIALGDVNDPEFGSTHANAAFTITPSILGGYPFINKDSVTVDSVVLSLSYQGAWGDTISNGIQTLRVYEVGSTSGFRDDTLYRYNDPTSDYAANAGGIVGSELGSKTFTIKSLKDSVTIIRKRDTSKVANVVRIRLNNSLGARFTQYDTSNNITRGGYHADSTSGGIFRKLFRGIAIKADNSGNALAYFSLSDASKTKLTVYFRAIKNGITDTSSFDFIHRSNGRANYVNHAPGNQWLAYLNNSNTSDDKLYIQTSPSGAYASIVIPGLSSLQNSVIHKAELISSIIPSAMADKFTPPSQLFLDRMRRRGADTAFFFENDITITQTGAINFENFGGNLRTDNTYRFNITRYVQGIVTRNDRNDTLRLYAPFKTFVYSTTFRSNVQVSMLNRIAGGRVVLAGGSFVDPSKRLRLRVVYSKI